MLPYISFLGRDYPSYALLGLIGFFAAVTVAGSRAKQNNLLRSDLIFVGSFAGLGLIAGGVLLFGITQIPYMWENRDRFVSDFVSIMARSFGGMVFYGGLFGTVVGIRIYCRYINLPFSTAMKLLVPVFPLAHAIMRMGCFAGGCCYGIESAPPLGIAFTQSLGAPNGVHLLPVQLYEAAANVAIFVILWSFTKKERHWTVAACMYGLLYSTMRFFLEFLRGDVIRGFVFGLSTSQFISVIVFLVCVVGLMAVSRMRRKEEADIANSELQTASLPENNRTAHISNAFAGRI